MSRKLLNVGRRCRTLGGAAFLEVLAALILFSVAAAVISGAFYAAVRESELQQRESVALGIAQSVLNQIEVGLRPVEQPESVSEAASTQETEEWTVRVESTPYSYGLDEISGLQKIDVIVQDRSGRVQVHLCRLFLVPAGASRAEASSFEPLGPPPGTRQSPILP